MWIFAWGEHIKISIYYADIDFMQYFGSCTFKHAANIRIKIVTVVNTKWVTKMANLNGLADWWWTTCKPSICAKQSSKDIFH